LVFVWSSNLSGLAHHHHYKIFPVIPPFLSGFFTSLSMINKKHAIYCFNEKNSLSEAALRGSTFSFKKRYSRFLLIFMQCNINTSAMQQKDRFPGEGLSRALGLEHRGRLILLRYPMAGRGAD
jgi:hypothetical protein